LLLVCLALIWGAHWPVSKIGLRDLPPFTYGTLRVVTGVVTLAILLAFRRGLHLPTRQDLPVVFSVGIGQMASGIILMNLALSMISAGRASVLYYTMPLWIAAIKFRDLRAGGARRQLIGLAFGVGGIVVLLNPAAIDWSSSGVLLGCAALLFSAFCWALVTIHLRAHKWHATTLELEPWQLLVALVPIATAAVALEWGRTIHWEPTAIAAILFSGPLATAVAYWLSQSISRSLSPFAATMGFLAVPVVGLASSAILLGEPITPLDFVGAAATFLGIVVISVAPRPARDPAGAEPAVDSIAGSGIIGSEPRPLGG
jgi:drug/metabolite transporter (DMT)-like permease